MILYCEGTGWDPGAHCITQYILQGMGGGGGGGGGNDVGETFLQIAW